MKFDFSRVFLGTGINYFTQDRPLQSVIRFIEFSDSGKLKEIGHYVGTELIEDSIFLDHFGKPYFQMWGIRDERLDGVWISRSHRMMIERLLDMDTARTAVPGKLLHHFISGYLVSDSGLFCTLTLTAQTVYALYKYGGELTKKFLTRYLDDNLWLGATYYTEIQGGSDLGANLTTAVAEGDRYILNGGNKYFASNAGLADGAIVTARIPGSPAGAKGISAFFVPTIKDDGSRNYEVRRLKEKLGTVLVPTGEVTLDHSEGYLLGDGLPGIYIALEILELSRIDDAIAAVGMARKALWEAYLYSKSRTAFGRSLIEHPLMKRDLIEMESEVEASMVLSIIAADLFNRASHLKPPYDTSYLVARAFTHMAKFMASWSSDFVTRYAMEVFGGRGFLHEFPVEKFHRDSIVTSLWEGTSNIQSLDFLELTEKRSLGQDLLTMANELIEKITADQREICKSAFETVQKRYQICLSYSNREYFAKEIISNFSYLFSIIYMALIGQRMNDSSLVSSAEIFYYRHFCQGFPPDFNFVYHSKILDWMDQGNR
ncbi:MAG TPA: acyl-CoA dehydrogenase family protein [Thermoplasmataceae archaeon]|nr:acyl-CoA dehydrogenase family protein [Thermoplasmatales archaeon AK]HLH85861.1 acyl-CoA dehydrogenase family protein [Thermoplasmataceae archaeon]